MLSRNDVTTRLRLMSRSSDPHILWDQQCDGSAGALVVFVGPSPGFNPRDPRKRGPRMRNCCKALWNAKYEDPLGWSGGFKTGFKPMVEALIGVGWGRASKLMARGNLDWFGNPVSANVPEKFMRKGAPSVLAMIEDCQPSVVVPMDKRAFDVSRWALSRAGYNILDCDVTRFSVRINKGTSRHRQIYCFVAVGEEGKRIVVIKLPQHPAKLMHAGYAARCGTAVRKAAIQIGAGRPINVSL